MPLPKEKLYTSDEFLSFAETNSECMELINGEIVYLASPSTIHQRIVGFLYFSITSYIKANKGKCEAMLSPFDVRLNDDTVVIPDVSIICDSSKINDKRCNGSPDWIIEVASSNRFDDFYRKLLLYRENGVREYWIVDPKNEKTLVYFFDEGDFPCIYTFEQPILVNIYKNNPVQLSINISELLK